MNKFEYRLRVMRDNNISISHLIDIGAYRGEFSTMIRTLWPSVKIWQIEADTRQMQWLQPDAINAVLSNKSNIEVDFYTLPGDSITTGSSIYKELTPYYNNSIIIKKRTTTLDDIVTRGRFMGNWKNSGMVKLDTQGSELDILKGAESFIITYQPKYFIIETSVKPYNRGAPLIGEVISYMQHIGYKIQDFMHQVYDNSQELLQSDILFVRE